MRNPVHYGLCRQTVTVYRLAGETVERRVLPRVFLEWKRGRVWDKVGSARRNPFLMVVPGEDPAVEPGDKIVPGIGPELSREEWAALTDCPLVQWVEQKFWDGVAVHTEAGA